MRAIRGPMESLNAREGYDRAAPGTESGCYPLSSAKPPGWDRVQRLAHRMGWEDSRHAAGLVRTWLRGGRRVQVVTDANGAAAGP